MRRKAILQDEYVSSMQTYNIATVANKQNRFVIYMQRDDKNLP